MWWWDCLDRGYDWTSKLTDELVCLGVETLYADLGAFSRK